MDEKFIIKNLYKVYYKSNINTLVIANTLIVANSQQEAINLAYDYFSFDTLNESKEILSVEYQGTVIIGRKYSITNANELNDDD